MSKPSEVIVFYAPSEHERFQVTVRATDAYPDALNQAGKEASRVMRATIADALELYGLPDATKTAPTD